MIIAVVYENVIITDRILTPMGELVPPPMGFVITPVELMEPQVELAIGADVVALVIGRASDVVALGIDRAVDVVVLQIIRATDMVARQNERVRAAIATKVDFIFQFMIQMCDKDGRKRE
ncbi:hypothetical protein OROMI_007391 [Orobanche minor]